LHEYREPTFGIISSPRATAAALVHERKDILTYTVFALDLEQKASTTLLSVSNIPSDIFKVIPLKAPVGGSLLVGENELIHVDQAGKTNAVAVNEFARKLSGFPMADQSGLDLKLEGCVVNESYLDKGDALLILQSGNLALVNFKLDGRSVSGVSLQLLAQDRGMPVHLDYPSCIASMGDNKIFVGSEIGDSVLLSWSRKTAQLTRRKSQLNLLQEDADLSLDEEDMDDYDDDIYGTNPMSGQVTASSSSSVQGTYSFKVQDTLLNIAPLNDVKMVPSGNSLMIDGKSRHNRKVDHINLVSLSGHRNTGGLVIMSRSLDPVACQQHSVSKAQRIWSVKSPRPSNKSAHGGDTTSKGSDTYNQYLIVLRTSEAEEAKPVIYDLSKGSIEEAVKPEFESDAGATLAVGQLNGDNRIVQVSKGEIRSYDAGEFPISLSSYHLQPNAILIIYIFAGLPYGSHVWWHMTVLRGRIVWYMSTSNLFPQSFHSLQTSCQLWYGMSVLASGATWQLPSLNHRIVTMHQCPATATCISLESGTAAMIDAIAISRLITIIFRTWSCPNIPLE
jgi:cleavage and polyadenylation specificity factor subunit 1